MKFVEVNENVDVIISMIENAEEYVVIVSPYSNLAGWDNLIFAINKASNRNVKVGYYVREDDGDIGLEGINVNLFEVPKLHAKIFYSEKDTLISSGNLWSKTDINWVCILDTQEEIDDIHSFFETKIKPIAISYKNK